MDIPALSGYLEWNLIHDPLPHPLEPTTWSSIDPKPCKFGLLHLDVPETPIIQTPLAIVMNLDRSGSMNDECTDGKTKLTHLRHALINMCRLLSKYVTENVGMSVRICILAFSHDVASLFKSTLLTKEVGNGNVGNDDFVEILPENLPFIFEVLNRLDAWGLTNIEKSLKRSQTLMEDYSAKHPSHRLVHIQMTDGEATTGQMEFSTLASHLNPRYKHVFMGLGDDHDSFLLNYLADQCPLGEYRFLDQLERSGWICGEVLYNILYPWSVHSHEMSLCLKMSLGSLIYDWHTNTWVSELRVPSLSGNMKKDYHIAIASPHWIEDVVVALENADGELLNTVTSLPPLIDIRTMRTYLPDLTPYLLRQRVQESMFKVKQFALMYRRKDRRFDFIKKHMEQDNDREKRQTGLKEIQQELRLLYHQLEQEHQRYLRNDDEIKCAVETSWNAWIDPIADSTTENGETHENEVKSKADFIQVLMEDVLVTLRTLGTKRGFMYTSSRMMSQGNQYSYTPTGNTMNTVNNDGDDDDDGGDDNDSDRGDDDGDDDDNDYVDLAKTWKSIPTLTQPWNRDVARGSITTYANDSVISMMTQMQEQEPPL